MAYASTVTVTQKGRHLVVDISETEAGAASDEVEIGIGYNNLTLLGQSCKVTAGTGPGTVDPSVGNVTSATAGAGLIFINGTAAAGVVNNTTPIACYAPVGKLFHKSNLSDSTADHTVTTRYLFKIGW
jgi:hypothetical protein